MRRGASTNAKKARINEPTKTYANARRKLNSILKEFSFCKVSEVIHSPPKEGRPAFFHGTAITQSNSRFTSNSEKIFFDKGGRLRYNSMIEVGPCKLVDAAWGRDHISAQPQVGDILIGVLEPNTRGGKNNLSKVLKSWSRHGKILMELSRMVEFGTGVSEFETRNLLNQPECNMAQQAKSVRLISGDIVSGITTKNASDDFWMLARLILWGNIRPFVVLHSKESESKCKNQPTEIENTASLELKISTSSYDFITGVAFRLEDPEILTDFMDCFIQEESIPNQQISHPFNPQNNLQYTPIINPHYNSQINSQVFQAILPQMSSFGYGYQNDVLQQVHNQQLHNQQQVHNQYQENIQTFSTSMYAPSSPAYEPSSPPYIPSSPKHTVHNSETTPSNASIKMYNPESSYSHSTPPYSQSTPPYGNSPIQSSSKESPKDYNPSCPTSTVYKSISPPKSPIVSYEEL